MTQDVSSSLPSRWATPEQAKLLLDIKLRPALVFLMAGALSTGELAEKLGVDLQRAHYLLGKLSRAGIAEVVEVQQRAGRAIRRYRVFEDWYVPFEVTQAATLTELLQAQLLPRMQDVVTLMIRSLFAWRQVWGFRLIGPSMQLLGPDGTSPFDGPLDGTSPFTGPPLLGSVGSLDLTPERAVELQQRLITLMNEFVEAPQPQPGRPYTVGLFLTEGQTY